MSSHNPIDQIRAEQTAEGRRILGLPASASRQRGGYPPSTRKRFGGLPKKPEGHEALLKALEASGGEIEVLFRDEESSVSGRVKHSDKFTVSIQPENGKPFVIFKHAMQGFVVLTDPPSKGNESEAEGD